MDISQRFFDLLDNSANTQKDFSEKTGIKESTLSTWRKRKTDPPAKYIFAIANYFDVSCEFLLVGKEKSEKKLSPDEYELINEFRKLDFKGKTAVMQVALNEQERMEYQKNQAGDTTA